MIAIRPNGTRTLRMTMPLGRVISDSTSPTGSGRCATSRTPCAIPAMRLSVSRSRSAMTGVMTPADAAMSRALAARMSPSCASRLSAMQSRRRSLSA